MSIVSVSTITDGYVRCQGSTLFNLRENRLEKGHTRGRWSSWIWWISWELWKIRHCTDNYLATLSHFSGSDRNRRNHPYDDLWKHNDVTCTILSRHPSIFGGVLVYVWTVFVPRMAFWTYHYHRRLSVKQPVFWPFTRVNALQHQKKLEKFEENKK